MRTAKIILFVLTWLAYGLGTLPAADAVQAAGSIHHYDYPADQRTARDRCITDAGGYPAPSGAWAGVTQDQLNACQDATVWSSGRWNWNGRILVGVDN